MNVAENLMLQQMQQIAASMANSLPQTGGNKDQTSFQDMMDQTGKDTAEMGKDESVKDQPSPEKPSGTGNKENETPVQKTDVEEDPAVSQQLHGDPNAMQAVMDMFRPEIIDVSQTEAVIEAPVEAVTEVQAVVEPAVVGQEMPTAEVPVEMPVAESVENTPVQQVEEPVQQMAEPVVQEKAQETVQPEKVQVQQTEQPETPKEAPEAKVAQPEQTAETVETKVRDVPEARETRQEDNGGEQSQDGKAEANQQPVFRDVEAAPVKVGETYKSVDTQEPDMDEKLANMIRQAVDGGVQKIEIRLNPANLGQVTIEMTRDSSGALQVALHVVTGKAESLLSQHLDGLHAALQSYSQGQEVRLEVQRNQETPQQQQNQQQTNPDGHNQQGRRQPQQEQRHNEHTEDFIQKLRLGLLPADETI